MTSSSISLTLVSSQNKSNSSFLVNGVSYNYSIDNGLNLFIYSGTNFSSTTITKETFKFINFNTTASSLESDKLAETLEILPPQTLISVISVGSTPSTNITPKLIKVLGIYGSYLIRNFTSSKNFIICGSKGTNFGSASEKISAQDLTIGQNIGTPKNPLNILTIIGDNNPDLLLNDKSYNINYGKGINVISLNQHNLELIDTQSHNTCDNDDSSDKFVNNVNSLGADVIVILQVKGNFKNKLKSSAISLIKDTLGSRMIDNVENNSKNQWFLLNKKNLTFSPMEFYSSDNKIIGKFYALGIKDKSGKDGDHLDGENTAYRVSVGSSNRDSAINNFSMVSGFRVLKNFSQNTINYLGVVVIDDQNGIILNQKQYSLSSENDITECTNFLARHVSIGNLVLISLSQIMDTSKITDDLRHQISTLGGSLFDKVNLKSSYCLTGRKGSSPGSVPEHLTDDYSAVCLSSDFDFNKSLTRSFIEIDAQSVGTSSNSSDKPYIQLNHNNVPIDFGVGMNVVVINPTNGIIELQKTYNTSTSTNDSNDLSTMINGLEAGTIVVIAVKGDGANSLTQACRDSIASLGSQEIKNLSKNNSFSLIGIKGGNISQTTECFSNNSTTLCSSWLFASDIFHKVPTVEISLHSQGKVVDNKGYCNISINGSDSGLNYKRGLNVVTISQAGEILNKLTFKKDNSKSGSSDNRKTIEEFTDFVLELKPGTIVVASVQGNIGKLSNKAKDGFLMIGSEDIQFLKAKGSFSIIGIKGAAPGSILESYSNSTMCSLSTSVPCQADNEQFFFAILIGIAIFATFSLVVTAAVIDYKYGGQNYPGYVNGYPNVAATCFTGSTKRALFVSLSYKEPPIKGSAEIPNAGQTLRGLMRNLINVGYLNASNCKLLTDEISEEIDNNKDNKGPSGPNVKDEINNFLVKDAKKGDVLLFAYLGHCNRDPPPNPGGGFDKFKNCSLSTRSDTFKHYRDSIENDKLRDLFNSVPQGVNVTWIMNCCFAKGVSMTNDKPTLSKNLITLNTQDQNLSAMFKASLAISMKSYLSRQLANEFTNYNEIFSQSKKRMKESNNFDNCSIDNYTTQNLSTLEFLSPFK